MLHIEWHIKPTQNPPRGTLQRACIAQGLPREMGDRYQKASIPSAESQKGNALMRNNDSKGILSSLTLRLYLT